MNKNEENLNKLLKSRKPSADLSQLRIVQKHLVYVIGLSNSLTNKDTLSKQEFFGQYGTIVKLIVNKSKAYNPTGINGPSYSAYVSYSSPLEASLAVLAVDNFSYDNHVLRASFGTTKYCSFFLKSLECSNKDCLYLHYYASEEDILSKDEMQSNKGIFCEQVLLAIKNADLYNKEIKKKLLKNSRKRYNFPNVESIYNKQVVILNDPQNIKSEEELNINNNINNNINIKDNFNNNASLLNKKAKKGSLSEILNCSKDSNIHEKNLNESLSLLSNSNNSTFNNTFNSNLSSSNEFNYNNKNENEKINMIYTKKEESRFKFTNKQIKQDNIPEYIEDYIIKISKRFNYFKTFDFSINKQEILLKVDKTNKNDDWLKYLNEFQN